MKSGAGRPSPLQENICLLCISITVTVLSQEFVVISSSYFCYLLYAFLLHLCIGCPGPDPSPSITISRDHQCCTMLPVFSSLLAVNQIKSSMLRTFLCYDQYCDFQQKTFKCTVLVYTV